MRYRLLGVGSGLQISELALGCSLFGTRWNYGADAAESRRIFDGYVEAGGNFVDTADTYQSGESESLLGEFIVDKRNDILLATKFTLGANPLAGPLQVGNSRKAMIRSVEDSLRRLRTDRIDLLWVHMPDNTTSSEELIRALNDLVVSGKVLYIGLSNFPAWRVARMAAIAELRGWAPIIAAQFEYSLVERSADRELIPMAEALGIGRMGWSPLGGGLLTGKYRRGETGRSTLFKELVYTESDTAKAAVVEGLLAVADDIGAIPIVVALSWLSAHGVIPIIGPRTAAQLTDNLAAAGFDLSPAHLAQLDAVSANSLGYPHEMLNARRVADRERGYEIPALAIK